ncbi:MAG: nitrous oxide reductase family maturation protein NosD, partial [Dehalococcoidia bacterium]
FPLEIDALSRLILYWKRLALTIERYDDTGANPQVKASSASYHVFDVTASNVTIRGLDIYGATDSKAGIRLAEGTDNCTIRNNRCGWDESHGNWHGILLDGGSSHYTESNTISGNTCSYNRNYNIYIGLNCLYNTISDNVCNNSETQHGVLLYSASSNAISANTCNGNGEAGIMLAQYSTSNIVSGNTCNNNDEGIHLYHSGVDDNIFYLNSMSDNSNGNAVAVSGTDNTWNSPVKLSYRYNGSAYKNYLGNYYSDYGGSDDDGDGIGDASYSDENGYMTDNFPLMATRCDYTLMTWWLGNPTMYKDDMSTTPGTYTVRNNDSVVWVADYHAPSDLTFPESSTSNGTCWTYQIAFDEAFDPETNITLTVGYADLDGNNFTTAEHSGNPSVSLDASENTRVFYGTISDTQSFDVPSGKYLALEIDNNTGSDRNVMRGASWSFISASHTESTPTPAYPVSELPTIVLAGMGLLGLGIYLWLRKRRKVQSASA